MMIRILMPLFLLLSIHLAAQPEQDLRVEPPFWWTGFIHPEVQLLVHAPGIGATLAEIRHPGVEIVALDTVESPNYLFITLRLTPKAKPGSFPIRFMKGKKVVATYTYRLLERDNPSGKFQGFNPSDVIYMLMPDRFANGDTLNDNLPGMRQQVNRQDPNGRHGGDIKGIMDHLDYLQELGVTTLWINPLLENNQEIYSYHGYSTTDYYRIDPRFGSNEDYVKLAAEIHRRGMKLIMDMVFNHCGTFNWWMTDLPSADWINQWPEYTQSNYRGGTVSDPYAAPSDQERIVKGWFDKTMPDLNQHHPFLKNYLIQNSIWWTEYAKLDGIRQDTHPYPFKDMMADWCNRVGEEYPGFNIVGECWLPYPAAVSYWQKDQTNRDGYNSNLPAVLDFPLYDALKAAFHEPEGWSTGIVRLYDLLSQDFVYPDPSNLVIFADNHDVNRYLDTQNDDIRNLKMAMAFILTTRGIPQIFYGTEFLMTTGEDEGHGMIRRDVVGGWPGDSRDAFTAAGRTPAEQDMYDYMQRLIRWRNQQPVIHHGQLCHYIPENGVYVYFRYNDKDTVMVAMNNNDSTVTLNTRRYRRFIPEGATGTDILTKERLSSMDTLSLPAKSATILELND